MFLSILLERRKNKVLILSVFTVEKTQDSLHTLAGGQVPTRYEASASTEQKNMALPFFMLTLERG
jgi:hypothetical protein